MTEPVQSPVFDRASRMQAQVTQPTSPWGLALGLAVCAVLGVIAFATLSAGRQARAEAQLRPPPASFAKPAFVATPTSAPARMVAQPSPITTPPPMATPLAPDPARRWRSPAMVVDLSDPGGGAPSPSAATGGPSAPAAAGEDRDVSAEDRFASRVASGGVETAHATRLRDMARVAPQGTIIPAVLETAINSDLPGSVRAVVSQDVRGFDGSLVLIPRGSKLIGQYRNGVAQAQSRVFVIWSRILTPEGVSIEVGSPGTDPLGRGGLAGETDSHFLSRFGGAILLTTLNVGAQAAMARGGTNTAIIIGGGGQTSPLAGAFPQRGADIPVTVKVPQGAPLQVFVTRDLDFSSVTPRP